jgi:hypothetical protein
VIAASLEELDGTQLAAMGLGNLRLAQRDAVEVGLSLSGRCPRPEERLGEHKVRLELPRGTSTAVHALIRAQDLAPDEYQLINVVELSGDKVLGGLGLVVHGVEEGEVR